MYWILGKEEVDLVLESGQEERAEKREVNIKYKANHFTWLYKTLLASPFVAIATFEIQAENF